MIKEEDIKEGLRFTLPNEKEKLRSKAIMNGNYPDDWLLSGYAVTIETKLGDMLGDTITFLSPRQPIFEIVSIDTIFNIASVSIQTTPEEKLYDICLDFIMQYGTIADIKPNEETFHRNGCEYIETKVEQVNHPSHYSWLKDLCGVEPLDICRHFDFAIGNALKYLMRKGKIDGDKSEREKRIEDLEKAVFYIKDEIKLLQNE